jgi:potassium-transporting ATPase potassium-binding subunit
MEALALINLAVFLGVLVLVAYPLGLFIARVAGATNPAGSVLGRVESFLYRVAGVDPQEDMSWRKYAVSLLVFSFIGVLVVYAVQRLQLLLPLNPQGFAGVSADSSFNTALSFVTNANWQGYGGESTMSYLTQMAALAVQNFFSAACGMAVAFALIRGFARRVLATDATGKNGLGNLWVDITRCTVYVLLPLSFLFAVVLVSQGVIQNFDKYREVATLDTVTYEVPKLDAAGAPLKHASGAPLVDKVSSKTQTLAMGPVASQEAIKMIGTNGGGFFNANSAHPFENPTPLTNFLQMLAIFLIPAALCFAFGRMVGDMRQGWAIVAAMSVIFVAFALLALWSEAHGNPGFSALGVDISGGNLEGKETRFGAIASALFATITTAASCGAVNAMHDSLMPLGGFATMLLMQLGEVVFGGVGSGFYGMLLFAVLAVFIAGLMIGRTPEYLGKKIQSFEMKMVSIAILATPLMVLVGTALAVMLDPGKAGISNPGAHGFSQVLYALSSAANNNGSAFAGLSANTPFYNVLLGIAVWVGRFGVIVPVLAIAGSLANKQRSEATVGTMPTHGVLFVVLLIGSVIFVGALTYVPALALGPVVEHLQVFVK